MSAAAQKSTGRVAMSARSVRARARQPSSTATSQADALSALQASAGNRALSHALGGGHALPSDVREAMEARFGAGFADVRVHDDLRAQRSAEALRAKAYTRGNAIVFNAGRFAPQSAEGRRLLAHELAHVVQQSRAGGTAATTAHEADADAAAAAVGRGAPALVAQAAAPGVQREPLSGFEIDSLSLDAVEARLEANAEEAAPIVLSVEAEQTLADERRALEARRDALTQATAPGINAPVPAPAPPPGVPTIKLLPEAAEPAAERAERLRDHPADAAQAAQLAAHGIEHYGASPVPYADGTGPHRVIRVGDYILGPNAIECRDGSFAVQYYIAYHVPTKDNHWVVGPDSVDAFRERYAKDKDLLEYEGSLHPYEVDSVRWVNEAMAGNWGKAFGHLGDAWTGAVQDPKWQVQAIAAHIPVERVLGPAVQFVARRAAPVMLSASMRATGEVLAPTAAREAPALVQAATRTAVAESRPAVAAATAPLKSEAAAAAPLAKQAMQAARPQGLPVAPMVGRTAAQVGARELAPSAKPARSSPPAQTEAPAPAGKAGAPKQAKPAKKPKPAKTAKTAKKTATPKPPKAATAKPKAPRQPKAAETPKSIDEQIAETKQALKKSRQKTSDYFAKRKAAGRSQKGGPKKGIDNAKERLWLLERQKAYPKRQLLENAEIKGVRGPDGKLASTKSIAGTGRKPDYVEIDNGKAVTGDLKSEWELDKSLVGGPGTAQGGTTSVVPKSKLGGQWDVEDRVMAHARKTNGKVVITGRDVRTGKTVTLELDPDDVSQGLFSATSGWGPGNVWTQ